MGPQAVGIDEHLELLVALAPDRHVGHAGNRHQPRPDRPAGQHGQIHLRERFRSQTPIFSTRLVDECGGMITGGLATAGSRDASTANRSCTSCRARIRSVPSSKIILHRRQPEHRLRTDRLQKRRAVECVLQRHANQALDFHGREPGRFGLDLDQRRRELGEHVERRRLERPDAVHDQQRRQRQHQHAQPQRSGNQPGHPAQLSATSAETRFTCRIRTPCRTVRQRPP